MSYTNFTEKGGTMPPKPPEIYRKLLKEGWEENGGKGSHKKMTRKGEVIILPYHNKELSKGVWESIRKKAGWK
ncbi:MAG: type II toxin-antitoxin system HicA family toxin [Raoultibacter sp.]